MPFVGGQSHERQRNGRLFAAAGYARAGTGHRSGSGIAADGRGVDGITAGAGASALAIDRSPAMARPDRLVRGGGDADSARCKSGVRARGRGGRDGTVDVLCSFYGSHGMQYASRLRDGLTIAQNHQALHEHRMALIDAGELIGAPDFVHQQWIRRYDLALTLRRRVVRAYPILNLKSAQIELRADSGLNVTARIPER